MSRIRLPLYALVVAGIAVVVGSTPALAHDELLESTPARGERLVAAPAEVSLEFSADVLTMGAAVIIADASGRDWAVGDPLVDAGRVTVEVDASMPDAGYEVRWRVVSSDGHPISGLIPFTVGDAQPLVRESVVPAPGAPAQDDQGTQENQRALRVALIGAGGATVAVALLALIRFLRRRRVSAQQGGTGDRVD